MHHIPKLRVQTVRENSLKVESKKIDGSATCVRLFEEYFRELGEDREVFVVATLNTKNVVTGITQVSMGTLDSSLVHPRETFRLAVLNGASSIVLSHNHPSGDNEPSSADISVTARLIEAGKLLGIDVLDHIVVGDTGHSIRENNFSLKW